MNKINLFEAKAKLSEICLKVVSDGQSIIVTKRGQPYVKIVPFDQNDNATSVWETADLFWQKNGGDFN